MKKLRNRIISFLMAALLLFSLTNAAVPVTADAAAVSPYMYWDSDGHGWGNKGIKNGCLVVALTKMLINTGIKSTSYTPDKLYAYIKARTGFNSQNGMKGDWPKTVAGISGKLYNDNVSHSLSVYGNGVSVAKTTPYYNDVVTFYAKWNKAAGTQSTQTENNSTQTTTESKPTETTPVASTLKITNAYLPTGFKLAQGKAFTIAGRITSNYAISSVMVKVETSAGVQKFAASATPNALSYDIYSLDKYMQFSKLPVGTYKITVTAKDKMTSKTLVSGQFTVAANSLNVAGSGMKYPSGTLQKGATFGVYGTVSSSSNLKQVELVVRKIDGFIMFQAKAAPNAKSYNIHNLDAQMKFRTLGAGKYIYQVIATDANNTKVYLISMSFTEA